MLDGVLLNRSFDEGLLHPSDGFIDARVRLYRRAGKAGTKMILAKLAISSNALMAHMEHYCSDKEGSILASLDPIGH